MQNNTNPVISFGMHPLDGHVRRKILVARGLSKFRKVLLVDGAVPLSFLWKKNRSKDAKERLSRIWSLKQEAENLFTYTAVPSIPGEKYSFIIRILNNLVKILWLRFIVSRVAVKNGFINPVVIVYEPWLYPAAGYFNKAMLIYDCIDDHAMLAKSRIERNMLRHLTERLARKADIAIAVNPELAESLKSYRATTHVLRHSVDLTIFDKSLMNRKHEFISKYVPDIDSSKKIVVYSGLIDELRIDTELLEYVISNNKAVFIFVGEKSLGVHDGFLSSGNVRYFKQIDQRSIAEILSAADSAIIPFKINEITKNVRSLKLMEYFAFGLPVIATPLDSLKEFEGLIYFGGTPEGFAVKLNDAINEPSDSRLRNTRIELASTYSIDKIMSQYNSHIVQAENNKINSSSDSTR